MKLLQELQRLAEAKDPKDTTTIDWVDILPDDDVIECEHCGEPVDATTAKNGMHPSCYNQGKAEYNEDEETVTSSEPEQPVSMDDIADLIKKLAVQQQKQFGTDESNINKPGMFGGPGDVQQNVRSIMYKLNQHFGIR